MENIQNKLAMIVNDPWLEPYAETIERRHQEAIKKEQELTKKEKTTLSSFASGHLYFGMHRTKKGWIFREWAPNAKEIYLIGDFNDWKETAAYKLKKVKGSNGNWEIELPVESIKHGDLYKLKVRWEEGEGERIPAWVRRVVQDDVTKIFSAQVWEPETSYRFKKRVFRPKTDPLFIYECHIGMAQEGEVVGSYNEFREKILPRIIAGGYNCIQIMGIQEHPYYGSFGYHVSNFFACSSRFGTPEELKELIDTAHQAGIAVIMDLVHSHAVKNEFEGLGNLAGDPSQYFYPGAKREHIQWDSLCFDYGKNEVLHFLLSNCRYWLEEFRFDGFRFDGVTSMLYNSHGLGEAFMGYSDYYNGGEDSAAICYLTLANKLIHEVNSKAITIAEEVSGMPGLAAPIETGGYGFDYRMAMNIPDFWIKLLKEKIDEDWKPSSLWWEVTNRRQDEKTISYAESHDQALVGDKTIIFRLIDADMYWHFQKGDENYNVHRGIALHKMIRLLTASTINGGYLNFMGNEFGHPEWIDFPREGNRWSHKYARRQWNLVDNKNLCYHYLNDFDVAMLQTISTTNVEKEVLQEIWHDDNDQILAFKRKNLIFVFNFSPVKSYTDYGFLVPTGKYKIVLNSDSKSFGGNGFIDETVEHLTNFDPLYKKDKKEWLKLYIPARTAVVLKKI
ncbi:MAG: alpha amylase C-terminal domain-containing protein [Phocaeicola sp.]